MDAAAVAGQQKQSPSVLSTLDRRLIARLIPYVPRSIQSHHLTMLTLVWSGCVLAGYALAAGDRRWLWAVSAVVVLQYVTDAIDGKLGALRRDGLVRWGFFMDHLLDYVFLCSLLLGYALLVPPQLLWMMMAILVVAAGFMVSSFLACAVEGALGISYLRVGPVEVRILFIAINTWLTVFGHAPLSAILPVVLALSLALLCAFVTRTQSRLWRLDSQSRPAVTNHQSAIDAHPSHSLMIVSRRSNPKARSLTTTMGGP
jgi:phosphatidylglycerophosphate synthase